MLCYESRRFLPHLHVCPFDWFINVYMVATIQVGTKIPKENVLRGYREDRFIYLWERPYQHDSTASRLLSEVKHVRAWLVLRWGTTLESQVLFSFFKYYHGLLGTVSHSVTLLNYGAMANNIRCLHIVSILGACFRHLLLLPWKQTAYQKDRAEAKLTDSVLVSYFKWIASKVVVQRNSTI